MRRERTLYVDKTRFLHDLEQERYAFLIRPRRFGKSCWVSLLESYYDRTRAGRFEAIFGGTDIARHPTPNRHRYVILRFDFSAFDDTLETLPNGSRPTASPSSAPRWNGIGTCFRTRRSIASWPLTPSTGG